MRNKWNTRIKITETVDVKPVKKTISFCSELPRQLCNESIDENSDAVKIIGKQPNSWIYQDKIIEELNNVSDQGERVRVIERSINLFAHTKVEVHDDEIQQGADGAIVKVLEDILESEEDEDLVSICSTLEMVYRCSASSIQISYTNHGERVTEHLLTVIQKCLNGTILGKQIALQSTMKVLYRYCLRINDAKTDMASNARLLKIVSQVSTHDVGSGTKEDAMGIIRNIALPSKENRLLLASKPFLLDAIVVTALNEKNNYKIRENCSAILWYLAVESEIRAKVLFHHGVIDALMRLTSDLYLKTKLNAVSAIGNLATAPHTKSHLLKHRSGEVLDIFLDIFRRREDSDVVRRAGRTLRHLVNKETVGLIVIHNGFLDGLTDCILTDKYEEGYQSVKIMNILSAEINSPLPEHHLILKALTESALTGEPSIREIVARTFSEQASMKENRSAMVDHPEFLKVLGQMILEQNCTVETMEYVVCTIANLCSVKYGKRRLVIEPILLALEKISISNETSQSVLAGIIVRLASLPQNRAILANYCGLIGCLARSLQDI
eukprot:CAMPEP_0194272404 /NCGR_PEP_ID=MMETSP0169-20130528/5987_1 /TAXON_ID=218684 /ORGANISM="Corethron pennatum, Strain L29A3" /LENGTH=552 /DNA_ID=CAMNT_0039015061 /DNA_START=151 /DNA_END=1806 /DNA_ORIENTATION=-